MTREPEGRTQRAQAVAESRYWLKITNTCNQSCRFCLDADKRDGPPLVGYDEICARIQEAHSAGYERLVISGGEASIHPRFVEIIAFARRTGFQAIQTISNGRMFAYRTLTQAAVDAGLTEITFSIHGPTAEVHDTLTGIPGSFSQAITGLRNAQDTGRCVVNIDVVVNRQNLPHVAEIIRRFSGLGVYEYDLLYVVPFGDAFEHREDLFFDHADAIEHLREAFAFSRDPRFHIWTNRFPPYYLEGYEALIQSPHKLYDELLGRRPMFDAHGAGAPLPCHPDHCERCFVRPLCRRLRDHVRQRQDPEGITRLATTRADERFWDLLARLPPGREARVVVTAETRDVLEVHADDLARLGRLTLCCRDTTPGARVLQLQERGVALCQEWSAPPPDLAWEAAGELRLVWTPEMRAWLDHGGARASHPLTLRLPTVERLADAEVLYDGALDAMRRGPGWPLQDAPPCLAPGARFLPRGWHHAEAFHPDGAIDDSHLVRQFILEDYFVKSIRCDGCSHRTQCSGAPIHFIRTVGFAALSPLSDGSTAR